MTRERSHPGASTSLELLLLDGSIQIQQSGCFIVTSPQNPLYHWGNSVQVTDGDIDDAAHWIDVFTGAFPHARWLSIGLPRQPQIDAYQSRGIRVDMEESLTCRNSLESRPAPPGYTIRSLSSASDWDQMLTASLREAKEDPSGDPTLHHYFLQLEFASRVRLHRAGILTWWGAFDASGTLCADLGIALMGAQARFQAVRTHPRHRRRGLAGHLLGVAGSWAQAHGVTELVIVADPGSPASRLYRSLGFAHAADECAAYRPPSFTQ
ncbi:hypothetical protein KEM60_00908 [Austwickia sp. TVS 96-490-7B]|uniref:GNAT family N-acetyltransferase n=1 Tax=Austwickia sp. TVS 96-490-7B TaxID=2830843 RepID=UPI001C59BFFB|nr:GNAT family N-acetyltransferase [Austwickia sp. TVS 96-490-7B]MBW3084719.1 hypothetical protein [Austwickia sp. TVS 96-490-7B]